MFPKRSSVINSSYSGQQQFSYNMQHSAQMALNYINLAYSACSNVSLCLILCMLEIYYDRWCLYWMSSCWIMLMLSAIMLSVIMLCIIMLKAANAECRSTERHYGLMSFMLSVIILNAAYVESRHTECRSCGVSLPLMLLMLNVVILNVIYAAPFMLNDALYTEFHFAAYYISWVPLC